MTARMPSAGEHFKSVKFGVVSDGHIACPPIIVPPYLWRKRYETSPKTISASDRGRCRAVGIAAHGDGASLSVTASAHRAWTSGGRQSGCDRAPHRSMAVGAAGPADHH